MEACSFGENPGDCHKTSYVRTSGLKSLRHFTEEEQKVLLWRGGERKCITDADQLNICYHHHYKLWTIFEKSFTKCCNLFQTHKRNVKGGHKISSQLASKLLDKGYECIPGWQFCRACYDRAQNLDIDMSQTGHKSPQSANKLGSTTTDYSTSDIDSDEVQKQSRDTLNKCLQCIGSTPVRTRSMPEHRRVTYASEKLQRSVGCLKRSFAAAIGVEESSLKVGNVEDSTEPSMSQEIKTKADDLDRLTEQMREKLLRSTTSEEKIKILTLTPESWGRLYERWINRYPVDNSLSNG